MSLIRKILDINTDDILTIMVSPQDDPMDAPTRRYMVVSEIEGRYNFIYDQFIEQCEENDDLPDESPIRRASEFVQGGGVLPSFTDMPEDVQVSIFEYLDSEDSQISVYDLEKVAALVQAPPPLKLRPEDLPERPFGAPADYWSPNYRGPEPAV